MLEWVKILGPTLLVSLGGIVAWYLKSKSEELRAIEQKLREERTQIYIRALEPYIRILASSEPKSLAAATKQVQSFEWQNTGTQLVLFGSDSVVRAWNDFAQFTYRLGEPDSNLDPRQMLVLFGKLLLEVRKSVGNQDTALKPLETVRWKIKDVDALGQGEV